MPTAMKPAAMPRSSLQLDRLGADRAGPAPRLVQRRGLADQVRQPGRAPGHEHRDAAGVGGGQVERAGRQVAVPQQRVAAAEVDQVPLPGPHRRRDPLAARVGGRLRGRGLARGLRRRLVHPRRLTNRHDGLPVRLPSWTAGRAAAVMWAKGAATGP